ncbi:GNAT family N-acetyltransferase [Brevibacillus laterosporus]|uniref:GNAT family N-acetyltransferase n=1 Tax=Brevibacillus laterosporus TaxID=1465 RepID=UPI000CE378CB|nr:GNAT family protein [Brevibacillus laterosporus]MED1666378.1 GNAT family protein [Brevibacillus laterosporus]MED1671725.1 GNAT family protein [Brevibacillus laterosporus]MED1720726.1 GNAT family protein [Brevibacillus laterosporus]PPA80887.1 GNAT family N-acetyltransferase [Brevibacillus laterosporus]
MLFQSARIYLRKMTADDVTIYHTWRNDMEVMRTTNPAIDLCTLDNTQEFVNQVILGSSASKSYMIIDKESETPIGIVSLIQIDYKNRNAECIIDIGEKAYWGKGYGMEALKLLLDYAFLELNLHRVSLRVFSFNKKAIALYERMAFKHEGISREYIFRDGKWSDVFHMGILQREYVATIAAVGN